MEKQIENQSIKISIIIPVYNTEHYFDRCINSIIRQSYDNLEIIVVNDGSKGNIDDLINNYQYDTRIRYLRHPENRGLYRARLTGVEAATGDYLAFVDSDDYVSYDYYHRMLAGALENSSDITIGKTVWENDDGKRFVYNMHETCFRFKRKTGKEVQQAYFGQQGNCYSWHTIWNKLYRKTLWDQAIPFLSEIQDHIIMTEDILFSSVLFYYAESVSTISNEAYFYCINEDASTNSAQMTMEKYRKNMHDIQAVFDSADRFLSENHADLFICENFYEMRKLYARLWRKYPELNFHGDQLNEAGILSRKFCKEEQEWDQMEDSFFSGVRTHWQGGLEYFKETIAKEENSVISFDIFDTVIQRPFWNPEDLFQLLDKKYEEYSHSSIRFATMRKEGEALARERYRHTHAKWEDITLSEIYQEIGKIYHLSDELTEIMKQEEIRLELFFCQIRNAGKELYELARLKKKTIVFVSDMYLEEDTICQILSKNGYDSYKNLYVSSHARKLKYNGALFQYMLQEEKCNAAEVLHIGDTWKSDIEGSEKAGIRHLFFPKARDIFANTVQGQMTNHCSDLDRLAISGVQDYETLQKNMAYSCMKAMAANRYFDNPYRAFHCESDLNGDPWLLGYYLLGMHMNGFMHWLMPVLNRQQYQKIWFMSRDGYLPMKIYQQFSEYFSLPESEYLYVSRKSVLTGMISEKSDFYDLPVEYRNHSPQSMLSILDHVCPLSEEEKRKAFVLMKENHLAYDQIFQTISDYHHFLDLYLEHIFSEKKYQEVRTTVKKYYDRIDVEDVTFDMGYSGRIQSAVSSIVEHPVDVIFIHADADRSIHARRKGGFQIHSYYEFMPSVSGLIREHILSEPAGSCIGFREESHGVSPIIEKNEKKYPDSFAVQMIHEGAEQFIHDWLCLFAEYEDYLRVPKQDSSAPFEGFLNYASELDLRMFQGASFEDTVYGGKQKINVYEFVKRQMFQNNKIKNQETLPVSWSQDQKYEFLIDLINQKNKITRGFILFFADRELFFSKLKKNIKKLIKMR